MPPKSKNIRSSLTVSSAQVLVNDILAIMLDGHYQRAIRRLAYPLDDNCRGLIDMAYAKTRQTVLEMLFQEACKTRGTDLEGTVNDPILPMLRKLAQDDPKIVSITQLKRRFDIPYGRGGKLYEILR